MRDSITFISGGSIIGLVCEEGYPLALQILAWFIPYFCAKVAHFYQLTQK
jgi:hypothetical protein